MLNFRVGALSFYGLNNNNDNNSNNNNNNIKNNNDNENYNGCDIILDVLGSFSKNTAKSVWEKLGMLRAEDVLV